MVTYGISLQTIIPVRRSPGDKNEMVNQLLFGDFVKVKDIFENWYLIESTDDEHEGWVDTNQLHSISEETYNQFLTSARFFLTDIFNESVNLKDNTSTRLVMGSQLPNLKNRTFTIEDESYSFNGNFISSQENLDKKLFKANTLKYLNTPYLLGGKSPFGIDCSGFVQMVYKLSGVFLKRDYTKQAQQGELINFIHESKLGDLAFFEDEEGNIIHVGIILDNEHIIHASGKVRIDKIDHNGIFSEQAKRYTHKLRLLKRIITEL